MCNNAGVQVGNYSHELRGLVQELLERNYQKRPCAAEILQRPIVQGEIRRMLLEEQAVKERSGGQKDGDTSMDVRPGANMGTAAGTCSSPGAYSYFRKS